MRLSTTSALFLSASLAASAAMPVPAQGSVPPLVVRTRNPSPTFDPANVTPPGIFTEVGQVHMVPFGSAGLFEVALSVKGLSTAYGGAGGWDLLTGSYDTQTGVFTANRQARALNTTADEFGLMFEVSARGAVFDRLGGSPWLAYRPDRASDWQPLSAILGLPVQSYYDPALAKLGDLPGLVYRHGDDIVFAILQGPMAVGSAVLVRPKRSGATANSPTPIVDRNGQLIGLSHHEVLNGDNDHYCSFDLDPATPAILMNDTSTWTNNGGFAGGRFFDAEYAPSNYHLLEMDAFWSTGGRASTGSTMEITAYVTPGSSLSPAYVSLLAVAWRFSVPQRVSGCRGLLGLDPSRFLTTLWMGVHDHGTGAASITLTIPPLPSLQGLRLPAQCLTASTSGQCFLGNTASLNVY